MFRSLELALFDVPPRWGRDAITMDRGWSVDGDESAPQDPSERIKEP